MSKWNKTAKPLTDQFIQNQQRRRQMIVQAAKRRRQKEKKLQQLNQNMKKNQEQALEKHKKQKEEAYKKYLKNNNMHDKYEQIKRNQKMQEQTKRSVSKWKRKDNSQNKNIQGLDLQKSHGKPHQQQIEKVKIQPNKKGTQAKKVVAQQFEKQWGQQQIQQMIGSKLIDSLDLDIDTLERGRQLNNKIQQIKNQKQSKPNIEKDEVEQLKNLIGYDSMLVSVDQIIKNQKATNKNINEKLKQKFQQKQKKVPQKKQVNEQQIFNNLKHKKQAKILQWATNNIVEQVDDLFSNCSSNKNSLLNRNNSKQNKGSKKMLQPIPEKKSFNNNKSIEKQKQKQKEIKEQIPICNQSLKKGHLSTKSNVTGQKAFNQSKQNQQKNKQSKQKQQKILSEKNVRKTIPFNINQIKKERSISKQKIKQNQAALQKQREKSLQKIKERRFSNQKPSSAQKPRKPIVQQKPQIPKTQQPFRIQKNAPVPPIPKPAYTVATQEQYFDVQSFIKYDLLQINQQQRKLQQQIRNIHINNKQKIKQIQKKHEIRTNYKNSTNLISKLQNNQQIETQIGYTQQYANQLNQDLIQNSIQRLDDLLIKRDIQSRQKTNNEQQSCLKTQQKSIINPFSKPQDLHKQILQLAENISKFENQPDQEVKGYGYQRKMKKKEKNKQQIPQQLSQSRNEPQQVKRSVQVKKIADKMPNPPLLEYSGKNNQIIEVNLEQRYYDPQDSLQTMKKQKIQVNQKLKNMLFDD